MVDIHSATAEIRRGKKEEERKKKPQSKNIMPHLLCRAAIKICPPFPQIVTIGAVVVVWRVRGKIIRSVLCNIVHNSCAQYSALCTHMNRPNSSLDWVLSHWTHFTVCRFILYMYYCMHV